VLVIRFSLSGQLKDLNDAISLHRDALKLRPAPHSRRSTSLNNLAVGLIKRFSMSGRGEDLDEAISFYRDALELSPINHPDRHKALNNLAGALRTRFEQSGHLEDLDQAISIHRDVLEQLPALHPGRSNYLCNLANALVVQFQHSNKYEDLNETINTYYESVDALVSGHPSTCRTSFNLGTTLMKAYFLTGELQYLDKSVVAFRVAVTCEAASTSDCFGAAKSWAHHADSCHESALDAYQAAIELLPRLATFGLELESRQQALTSSDGLARNAAACAIRSGQYDKAVELLEQGRAVFWSQALKLRTTMTDLRDTAPGLEEKLRYISLALEQGSVRDVASNMSPQQVISMEQEVSHFRHLNDDWLATVEEVRQLDGFQDFLHPKQLSTLQGAAADGPVVVLNASQSACDTLILTPTGVRHIPLPDLSITDVTKLVKLIHCAIAQDGRDILHPESNRAHIEGLVQQIPFISDTLQLLRWPLERHIGRVSDIFEQSDNIFRYVLGMLWEAVVEPIVHMLDLKVKSILSPTVSSSHTRCPYHF
jgi:tetratricopeptide (TPR) repeat protein